MQDGFPFGNQICVHLFAPELLEAKEFQASLVDLEFPSLLTMTPGALGVTLRPGSGPGVLCVCTDVLSPQVLPHPAALHVTLPRSQQSPSGPFVAHYPMCILQWAQQAALLRGPLPEPGITGWACLQWQMVALTAKLHSAL